MPLGTAYNADEIRVYRDTANDITAPVFSWMNTFNSKDYEKKREVLKLTMDGSSMVSNKLGKKAVTFSMKGVLRRDDPDVAVLRAAWNSDGTVEINLAYAFGDITVTDTLYDIAPFIVPELKLTANDDGLLDVDATFALGDCTLSVPLFDQQVP